MATEETNRIADELKLATGWEIWNLSSGGGNDSSNVSYDEQSTELRAETCHVYWRSHGCGLPRFHQGDSLSHECDPCPPDCRAPVDPDSLQDWAADHDGMCSVHCGSRPMRTDTLYGEDVDFFPKRSALIG